MDCGKQELGYVHCAKGHYICDHCHGEKSFNIILGLIASAEGINPLLIGEQIINEAPIPMLGCEHAWVAAGSLLAAIKNHGEIDVTEEQLIEVLNRTKKQAIGAYCGLTGICGVAPAIGAVYSVILGAACPKNEETAATMHVVSKVIEAIANETGPCCCKNFVHTALKVACDYSEKYLEIQLPSTHDIVCQHSDRHPHGCREQQCSYYSNQKEAKRTV
ncbi:conserved hypothetical protein [Alkaliphilus metalliredigens QYMF]|uniref:DUF5714 domain-containing protein n=2 Tax=Alkaliphilus TaxID=114627 RepID=A6TLX7_ALKMQ|nr:DUF5714 domain-containing protein [Alkaliphilus metalliredigens]ABR47195.1 conserved hypothetical protein [Alkaliphilus metalliredigens QYMF]